MWVITSKADPAVARLADRHYSRQHPGSRQFCPPGMTLILYIPGPTWPFEVWAGWAWWHPHPNAPMGRYDGYDGWWACSLFRNESPYRSSELIKEAVEIVNQVWGLP